MDTLIDCPDCDGTGGKDDWSYCKRCKSRGLIKKPDHDNDNKTPTDIGPRISNGSFYG